VDEMIQFLPQNNMGGKVGREITGITWMMT
jgi:hypothetical protein